MANDAIVFGMCEVGLKLKAFLFVLAVGQLLLPAYAQAKPDEFLKLANGRLLAPAPISDEIEVVDGDTLWVGVFQIRLFGIDAVEPKQPCSLEGRPQTYCHVGASDYLRTFTRHPEFRCEFHVVDGDNKPWINHGRYIATCYAGEVEVNRAMVRNGWALASDRATGNGYRVDEVSARRDKLGVHATVVEAPWRWRKSDREDDECSCP